MIIHKLKGLDDGVSIFVSVVCNSPIINRKRVSADNEEITCKKCLKLIKQPHRGKKA